MEIFKTKNPKETERLGWQFARNRLKSASGRDSGALVLYLFGELGSGKTSFVKGLARGLGIRKIITSPTYVFARSYTFPSFQMGDWVKNRLYHLDLYRLEEPDLKILNSFEFQEIIKDSSAIVVIEWAERLKFLGKSLKPSLIIEFGYNNEADREIKYTG